MKNKLLLILFLIIVFVAGFLWGKGESSLNQTQIISEESELNESPVDLETVSLMLDYGNGDFEVFEELKFNQGESLFDVTERVTKENNINFVFDPPGEWGVFVREIGERKNGEEERYWQYWVNNQQAQVAADNYILQSRDVIEWQFVKSQY